jgi:peroxiredoxin
MKRSFALLYVLCLQLCWVSFTAFAFDHPTLAIGAKAPDFKLPGIDGKTYTLASFKDAKILVIAFICDHCPTSQAYEQRLIKLTSDYADKGVKVVAINPNNPASLRYDELGWSDVGDSFEDMKERAKDRHFNFPYLYDGEKQVTANKYGPVSTPHVFIFDENRILRYNGRIDDTEDPQKTPHARDARNAIDALLNNTSVPVTVTKVFGCSIKWLEKKDWIDKANVKWAEDPVALDTIDASGITALLTNNSDKLRLINIWSVDNKISTEQFNDFITLSRIYVERDFEFININVDDYKKKDSVFAFLKKKESSGSNYIVTSTMKDKFTEVVNSNWNGKLPYTLLVEPGGKIVYTTQNKIDLEQMRRRIFNNEYVGRLYK